MTLLDLSASVLGESRPQLAVAQDAGDSVSEHLDVFDFDKQP